MAKSFLLEMRENVAARVANQNLDLDALREQAHSARTPYAFTDVFIHPITPYPIIAEIKFQSPALGVLRNQRDVIEIAADYLSSEAAAISVLTEPSRFSGDIAYIKTLRETFPNAYLLMKDFILCESQLLMAKIMGADAVLLIVEFLEQAELAALFHCATRLGLTVLVEVHTIAALKIAEAIGAQLIGVNCRNLTDLSVDTRVFSELMPAVTSDALIIAESGLTHASQLAELKAMGYDGFLIGGHFMQSSHPGHALAQLISGACDEN